MTLIAPSILSADFADLGREVQRVSSADWLHVDVMDGMFVSNISIGVPVVKSLRKATDMFLDVHLMIEKPVRYIDAFADAGADLLSIHLEADMPPGIRAALDAMDKKGVKKGIVLRPITAAEAVLPYVKDMNLGFQGILANTRLYDAPVGKMKDIQVAVRYYQEDWWLEQLIAEDHRAIYDHPGNHPHSTLLTTLEGYCDLYRVTGREKYISAVKHALKMYEEKWQHVGGGISMCEMDTYYPGCNWLSPSHHYNELCSTNFWVLLNQRMHRLEPDNAHYVDEMENSLYNVLLAAQVGDQGFHYLNFLQRTKDWRYLDRATCCAALGTRLTALLPQFLYTYTQDSVSCDIYAASEAQLPNGVSLRVETGLPDNGHVRVEVVREERPFTLRLRVPRWAAPEGKSFYQVHYGVQAGAVFTLDFPFAFRATRYTGGEQLRDCERWAVEYGPLLYAALGAPNPLTVHFDPQRPQDWFTPLPGEKRRLALRGDSAHSYMAYLDIHDEPFDVYPAVKDGENK